MDDVVNVWNTLIVDMRNRHAPIRKLTTKGTAKPWISDKIKKLMAERNYAFKIAKRSGNEQQWKNYRRLKTVK